MEMSRPLGKLKEWVASRHVSVSVYSNSGKRREKGDKCGEEDRGGHTWSLGRALRPKWRGCLHKGTQGPATQCGAGPCTSAHLGAFRSTRDLMN